MSTYVIIRFALESAVREGLVRGNAAKRMMGKPRVGPEDSPQDVVANCWEMDSGWTIPVAVRLLMPSVEAI